MKVKLKTWLLTFQPAKDFQVAAGIRLPEKLLIVSFLVLLQLWVKLHEQQV